MARNLYNFTNTIRFKLDRQSWNDVKKQSQKLAQQLAREADPNSPLSNNPSQPQSRRRRQPDHDSNARQYRKLNAEQAKFEQKQKEVLKRFVLSNAAIRDLDVSQKKVLLTQLKQARTVEELLHLERKLKTSVIDRNRKEKARTRELQKQQGISKNLAANLAGVYAAAASGNAVVQTGLTFESLERSMLVTSGSAEKAADNFKFVRSEALRLGQDITALTSNYVNFQAAAGNKLAQDDLRDIFSGIAEYSTALGLSQERQQRAYVSLNQALGKGQLYAEEIFGQLSEAAPGVIESLVKATVELGKIDKNLSYAEQEKQLRVLMKQGKLYSAEILPEMGRQLSIAANRNDQLAWSLKTGLQPQLSIAQTNIKEITNSFFSGLKPALMAITKSFNLLAGEGKGLAKVLGSGIGSALKAITFPFMMVGAILVDTYTYLRDLLNLTDEGITKFATFGAKVLGLSFGITRLIGGFKMLWNIGSKVVGFFTGGSKAASSMAKGVGGINAGLRGTLSLFSRLNVYLTGLLAVWEARPGGSMSFTSLFGDSKTAKWWDTPVLDHLRRAGKEISSNQQKVDVNVNVGVGVDPSNGSITPYVMSKIDESREQDLITFYQNLSPSN